MILQSTVKTEIGRQFFCVKFISAHLLYQFNHSLSLKDTWLFAFPCFFNKICQWIFYYNPEMFVELFWNSCQSCIKLNDLINSLSTRSFSQLLTFSLVNIGVVVLFRNYKKSWSSFCILFSSITSWLPMSFWICTWRALFFSKFKKNCVYLFPPHTMYICSLPLHLLQTFHIFLQSLV